MRNVSLHPFSVAALGLGQSASRLRNVAQRLLLSYFLKLLGDPELNICRSPSDVFKKKKIH